VVAHDYGGAVALRTHLLHESRFASLALVDVVALRPWGSPFFRLVAEHSGVFAALPATVHEGALRAYIAGASYVGLRPEHADALVAPWLGPEGQAAFYAQIAQADERLTAEIEPRLGCIDMPVTVIWGREDAWLPVDQAHRLAGMIPNAALHLIEGAGHLIQLDRPVELATRLGASMSDRAR
jgi:pimeloyl-ACP methyl ester carboxylesterase